MRREITDRRTLRTRQLLTDALGELIRTKRYEAITVQEIADRANVGRSTFYAHFSERYLMMARGRHLTLFLDALQGELTVMFVDRLSPRVPEAARTRVPVSLLAAMLAGMLITTVRTWVEAGMTDPAEEVNRCYRVAAEAALRAGLRPPD
jgi:AcrR family transcriptional regulator